MNHFRTFINAVAPKHSRTSCTDENSNGNEYFNESGAPRCARCALLYWEKYGQFPYGVTVKHLNIEFTGHERITT
jgi:hypothetical protein